MTFYRLTAPLYAAPSAARTGKPKDEDHEGLFARMFRLWIEHHERVAQFRLLDH